MFGRQTSILRILAAFLVGGLLGAGVVLLVAPQSGRQTRAMLRDKSIELKERAVGSVEELAQQTREKAAELTQRGKEVVGEQTAQLRNKVR